MAFILFAFGTLIGTAGPALGIGGGAFMVPFLIIFARLPMKSAVAVSLLAVVALSSLASSFNIRKSLVNLELGSSMVFSAMAGSAASAYVSFYLPEKVLMLAFSALLFLIAVSMLAKKETAACGANDGEYCYMDGCSGEKVVYNVKREKTVSLLSFFGGGLTGFFGIGGGIVHVPLLNLLAGVPIKAAAATSSFIVSISACSAAAMFINKGLAPFNFAAPMVLGVLAGSLFGVRILHRSKSRRIKKVFAILLLAMALETAVKALAL